MAQLLDFDNSSTSDSIVIVGNGPSLLKTPMNFKYPSFAMNRISLLYQQTSWRPDYFLCTTTNIADQDWRSDIVKSIDLGIPCFVWENLLEYLPRSYSNVVPIRCAFGDVVTNQPSLSLWCSDPLNKPLSKFGTSLLVAVQLAVFMRYKNIYLVGCDLGFKDPFLLHRVVNKLVNYTNKLTKFFDFKLKIKFDDSNHFSSSYGTPGFSSKVLNQNMTCAHEIIKLASTTYGFHVYNASLSGGLVIHDSVDIKTIIAR
jgi:hypothetical protein